mmetsp:Transcript_95974/g.169678  ORF Transcript_95974/g.169678 Transcript_95974/m.169678 type:complete len:275 (+) Transcript_95974:383-1207(+)
MQPALRIIFSLVCIHDNDVENLWQHCQPVGKDLADIHQGRICPVEVPRELDAQARDLLRWHGTWLASRKRPVTPTILTASSHQHRIELLHSLCALDWHPVAAESWRFCHASKSCQCGWQPEAADLSFGEHADLDRVLQRLLTAFWIQLLHLCIEVNVARMDLEGSCIERAIFIQVPGRHGQWCRQTSASGRGACRQTVDRRRNHDMLVLAMRPPHCKDNSTASEYFIHLDISLPRAETKRLLDVLLRLSAAVGAGLLDLLLEGHGHKIEFVSHL